VTPLGAVAAVLAGAVALVRWLRVSQREHYLPGQVGRCAVRWFARRPPNRAVAGAWGAATLVAIVAGVAGAGAEAVALAAGLAGALIGAAFPVGMTVMGKVRLRWTRRATTQGAIAAVVAASALAAVALVAGTGAGAALAPLVVGLAVDAAAALNRPVERRLAARHLARARARLARVAPRVVAVTGSYGKTTVKTHIRDLLAASFPTVASPASWNNQAGLSRTVNEHLAPGTEVLVAEMGTYGRGEIAELVSWLRPDVAVICAIGPVHLERMGSVEAILEAKAEILTGARVAVLCVDDPLLAGLADRVAGDVELWRAGSAGSAGRDDLDVQVVAVRGSAAAGDGDATAGDGGSGDAAPSQLVVRVRGDELGRVAAGSLHARNVACAVAAALAAGAPPRAVAAALPTLAPPSSRAQPVVADGLTIVDDTFNSNPAGARVAVETLTTLVPSGRRAVVSPGMVELGPVQDDANRDFAVAVERAGDDLVVVGWTNRAALVAGHGHAVTVPDRDAARDWVRRHLGSGDGVLWENDLPDHYP
jgi:UDP-N-acetylmuramoyl-tripeptide--D-alanyl-D-alanine ligase